MNVFAKIFNRFFSAERLIKPDRVLGELPNTKKLYGEYLKIAWPSMLETVLTSLTGFVDTMMVGTLTSSAITAVGLTSQPRLLIFSLFFSINAGITAVVSRKKGEGDRDGANAAMHTGLLMTLACVVAAFTFAFTCCDPLLKFAGATGENAAILPLSRTYFLIVIVGLCINAFGMTINAAQRACSNTRITFITSMIANGVNVVFNYLLIGGHFGFPALGVAGAAIATTFGNVCACAVSIFSVCRKNSYLKLRIKHFKAVSLKYAVMVGKVFSGAGLEQLFLRFGMFMFAKEVAELGTQEFATHQICMTIVTISFAFGDGLGVAASALVGQNLGKKRPDLSEVYAKAARNVGFAFSVIDIYTWQKLPCRSFHERSGDNRGRLKDNVYRCGSVAYADNPNYLHRLFERCGRYALYCGRVVFQHCASQAHTCACVLLHAWLWRYRRVVLALYRPAYPLCCFQFTLCGR